MFMHQRLLVLFVGFSFLTACAQTMGDGDRSNSLNPTQFPLPDFGVLDSSFIEEKEEAVKDVFGEKEGAALLDTILALSLDSSANDPNEMLRDISQAIVFLMAQRDMRISQEIQSLLKWMESQANALKKSKRKSDFRSFFQGVAKRLMQIVLKAIEKRI